MAIAAQTALITQAYTYQGWVMESHDICPSSVGRFLQMLGPVLPALWVKSQSIWIVKSDIKMNIRLLPSV